MKKLLAILAVVMLFCISTSVYAENTASINSTTFIATINADCPNADFALIMIQHRDSGEYLWASQEMVTNGSITNLSIPLDGDKMEDDELYGWYDIVVTDNNMGSGTISCYFVTQTYKDNVLGRINALKNNPATAETDLLGILRDEAPLFTYNTQMFGMVTDTAALYSAIIGETYTSIENFSLRVDEIVYEVQVRNDAIAAFNNASASGITTVLETYYNFFGITLSGVYYQNSNFINNILLDMTITDPTEIAPVFNTAIALAEVNNAERADLMNVIRSYDSYLGVYARLSSLSKESQNAALKLIEVRTYTNVADILQDIASVVISGTIDETPEYEEKENIISVSNDLLDAERPKIIQDVNDKGLVFYDLDDASWARDSILALYERGIVNGRTQTEFAPNSPITRAEYARLTVEAFEPQAVLEAEEFDDVQSGKWYYTSIMTARSAGIVSGNEDNCFLPENNLTMQDAAVILCKALGLDEVTAAELFADDADISGYAKGSVYALKAAGIVTGNENGNFCPLKQATRAQCAVMIYKALVEVE